MIWKQLSPTTEEGAICLHCKVEFTRVTTFEPITAYGWHLNDLCDICWEEETESQNFDVCVCGLKHGRGSE